MSKHIADSKRIVSGSARFGQYVRIDINGRPSLQSSELTALIQILTRDAFFKLIAARTRETPRVPVLPKIWPSASLTGPATSDRPQLQSPNAQLKHISVNARYGIGMDNLKTRTREARMMRLSKDS